MTYLLLISSFLLSVLLGMMIIPEILLISHKKRLFDMPDSRKVHTTPIPRLGGLSFFPVILITTCLVLGISYYAGFPIKNLPANAMFYEFPFITVGCMMLYLTGMTDDLIGVPYRRKFLVQVTAALMRLGINRIIRRHERMTGQTSN